MDRSADPKIVTMMIAELLRVHGDERWEEWGDDWWRHADRVGQFKTGVWAWMSTDVLVRRGYPHRRLDWGADMFELTKQDLMAEFGPDPVLGPVAPARRAGERWRKSIADLADGTYGFVLIECW